AGALGGPFIPAQLPKGAMSFERQIHRIQVTRAQISRLTRTLGAVPVHGRMVDIDHGNGLSTRYGHLSSIDVRVGQSIRTGQIIGKVGSPGRSTGPHLHYETRLRGEAIDPQKFLRAGHRLADGSL